MVKHTQTSRRQFVDGLFECVWPFCGIGAHVRLVDIKIEIVLTSRWEEYLQIIIFEKQLDTLVQIFILPMSFAKNDKSIQRSTERK